jgi:hypothetical protein
MGSLLAAEVLKLRTSRVTALLVLAAAAAAAVLIASPAVLVGASRDSHTALEGVAALVATLSLILGVHAAAGDMEHGLVRAGLLIAPRRERLLAAKLGVLAITGACLGAACVLLAELLQALTTAAATPHAVQVVVGGSVLSAGYAVLGTALGTLAAGQPLAIGGALLWIYVAEPFIAQQSYHVYSYLPGGLREALLHHTSAHHHIPSAATGAATLAIYVAATIALALTRFKRQAVA